MNFEDSPEEAAYRKTVRDWIAANAPDMSNLSAEERRNWHPAHKQVAREWQATKADAGYACISWPKEWGGAGGTAIEDAIFTQEEQRAGVQFTYFMTGLHMLLPALLEYNDDPGSLARVPPAVRGEEIWCQLFSEPASGSDSAGVRTSAVRDEDSGDWIVTGQKVWNSGAHVADYGMLVARTDPDLPKHKGLTALWLDMKSPGVEVRPIRIISGEAELNEVFLEEVRIPDSQRVGEVNGGWSVVISTLMNERAALGSGTGLNWRDVMKLADRVPSWDGDALDDPVFGEWLAELYVDAEAIRLLNFRTLTALSRGETPGPEGSAGKLLWSALAYNLSSMALDIEDHAGLLDDPASTLMNGAFQHRFLWSPGLRLGGGTDEIMKNIIAERVLGLPQDIRVDKKVPFREIPHGR